MTPAAIAWIAGRLLNTYTFSVETPEHAAPFISVRTSTAWGIPADAWAYAVAMDRLAGIIMVDVRSGETFTLAISPADRLGAWA